MMFLMILEVSQGGSPSPENYGNHSVFNDFSGWAGAPVTPHLPKNHENQHVFNDFKVWAWSPIASHPQKTMEITMFSMILEVGQGPHHLPPPSKQNRNQYVFYKFGGGAGGPSPPTCPKDYRKHHVFNDFGGGSGPLSPPTCDHYGQVVRKPDPDLVPNLVPTLCQAPPTRFSMGWGRGVLPTTPE